MPLNYFYFYSRHHHLMHLIRSIIYKYTRKYFNMALPLSPIKKHVRGRVHGHGHGHGDLWNLLLFLLLLKCLYLLARTEDRLLLPWYNICSFASAIYASIVHSLFLLSYYCSYKLTSKLRKSELYFQFHWCKISTMRVNK